MKLLFENDYLKIFDNKHYFDYKYIIVNKKNSKLNIFLNELDDYLEIDGNNWIGLFYDEYNVDIINCIINKKADYNY